MAKQSIKRNALLAATISGVLAFSAGSTSADVMMSADNAVITAAGGTMLHVSLTDATGNMVSAGTDTTISISSTNTGVVGDFSFVMATGHASTTLNVGGSMPQLDVAGTGKADLTATAGTATSSAVPLTVVADYLSGVTALDATGNPTTTNTTFLGGVSKNGGTYDNPQTATGTDTLDILLAVNPGTEDQGKSAKLINVVGFIDVPGNWSPAGTLWAFYQNADKSFSLWDWENNAPLGGVADVTLGTSHSSTVYNGSLAGMEGAFVFFNGYQTTDGALVYSSSVDLSVQ